jgi:hypothetical protein
LFYEDGQILLFAAPINYLWGNWLAEAALREEKALTEITRAGVLSVHIRAPYLSASASLPTYIDTDLGKKV